jgi:hypothetical protein
MPSSLVQPRGALTPTKSEGKDILGVDDLGLKASMRTEYRITAAFHPHPLEREKADHKISQITKSLNQNMELTPCPPRTHQK